MNSATDMGGNRTCIYLYAGLKAGNNICKWKIFELREKKCIMLKLSSTKTHTTTHTHIRTHVVRVLITVGVFILMLI